MHFKLLSSKNALVHASTLWYWLHNMIFKTITANSDIHMVQTRFSSWRNKTMQQQQEARRGTSLQSVFTW